MNLKKGSIICLLCTLLPAFLLLNDATAQVTFGKRMYFDNGVARPNGICRGYDNNFIMCTGKGNNAPNGTVITRLDTNGGITSSRFYEDSYGFALSSIRKTNDSGYICSGSYLLQPGSYLTDVLLTRMDSSGNVSWAKSYHTLDYDNCFNRDAIQTSDGGYVSCGALVSLIGGGFGLYDAFIMKTDSIGNLLWWRVFDQTNWDDFFTVKELPNGDILAVGFTWDNGLLIEFSPNGGIIWQKEYTGIDRTNFYNIELLNNSDFLLTGTCQGGMGTGYLLSFITDANGNPLNSAGFGYVDSTIGLFMGEEGWACNVNSQNEFLFGGLVSYSSSGRSSLLIKTDSALNLLYSKAIPNQQLILYTEEDINNNVYAFSLDNNIRIKYYRGFTDFTFNCYEADLELDRITPLITLSNLTPVQPATSFTTTVRSPVISPYLPISSFICVPTSLNNIQNSQDNLSIYPNPATDYVSLNNLSGFKKLNIYDTNGRLVQFFNLKENQPVFEFNVNNLSDGVYFLEGISETRLTRTKFCVNKL